MTKNSPGGKREHCLNMSPPSSQHPGDRQKRVEKRIGARGVERKTPPDLCTGSDTPRAEGPANNYPEVPQQAPLANQLNKWRESKLMHSERVRKQVARSAKLMHSERVRVRTEERTK